MPRNEMELIFRRLVVIILHEYLISITSVIFWIIRNGPRRKSISSTTDSLFDIRRKSEVHEFLEKINILER
jgi:hypothetical protein